MIEFISTVLISEVSLCTTTNNSFAILVKPFDVKAYADSLIRLMQDEQLRYRMGNRAYESSKRYYFEDIALQWKGLFDEVIANDGL